MILPPLGQSDIEVLRDNAYEAAEKYYDKHFDKSHGRIDPNSGFDEKIFMAYARMWLTMLYVWDHMHGQVSILSNPSDGLEGSLLTLLQNLDTFDCDEYLVSMYG